MSYFYYEAEHFYKTVVRHDGHHNAISFEEMRGEAEKYFSNGRTIKETDSIGN